MTARKAQPVTRAGEGLVSEGSRRNPLVFISHDSRDADLAEAFELFLTDVSTGMLKAFRSSDTRGNAGIEFGAEWYRTIMERLDEATDVVALLTPHSIDRPWILFESGVAKGILDSVVFGVALGVPLATASTGPFAQFQNCADDEDSLTKLARELITRNLPLAAPRDEALRRGVADLRNAIAGLLEKRQGEEPVQPQQQDEPVPKLFEELKVQLRDIAEAVERTGRRSGPYSRRARFSRIERQLSVAADHPDANVRLIAWLTVLTLARERVAWVYEPGLELYRAIAADKSEAVNTAAENLRNLAEAATLRGPDDGEEVHDREGYLFAREFPLMLEHYLSRFVTSALQSIEVDSRPRGRRGARGVSAPIET